MYLRLDLPPTKEQIKKAQRFIDGRNKPHHYYNITHVGIDKTLSNVYLKQMQRIMNPEGLNKFAPVDMHPFKYLK